jgi:hybrid cluster-associated redox disulfide protein
MKYVVNKDSLISEIVEKSPKVIKLLDEYGLSCATCFLGQFESIEQGAKLHGMTDKEIKRLISKINEVLKNEKI